MVYFPAPVSFTSIMKSVYYQIHKRVRVFPGPLAYGAETPNSNRGTLVCKRISNLLLKMRDERMSIVHNHSADATLFPSLNIFYFGSLNIIIMTAF